jgi:phosphopantothenoylcysteine decarboxylase/phosphopantothenate--cysteine ligase
MGGDRNRVRVLSRAGIEEWPEMSKEQVAEKLAEKIAAALLEIKS